jgi:hypothetical protein
MEEEQSIEETFNLLIKISEVSNSEEFFGWFGSLPGTWQAIVGLGLFGLAFAIFLMVFYLFPGKE